MFLHLGPSHCATPPMDICIGNLCIFTDLFMWPSRYSAKCGLLITISLSQSRKRHYKNMNKSFKANIQPCKIAVERKSYQCILVSDWTSARQCSHWKQYRLLFPSNSNWLGTLKRRV